MEVYSGAYRTKSVSDNVLFLQVDMPGSALEVGPGQLPAWTECVSGLPRNPS